MSLAFFHAGIPGRTEDEPERASACAVRRDGLLTEIVDLQKLIGFRPAWADLMSRALEPNVFLEPGFAVPLFQHCRPKGKMAFLLTWAEAGSDSRHTLLGLLPLTLPSGLFSFFARGAAHEHAPRGIPLFDRDRAAEALRHMMMWLRAHQQHPAGLLLSHVPIQGPTFALLRRYAEAANDGLFLFNEYERAALSKSAGPDAFPRAFISTKRRKHYRQQRRRLKESGEVTYRSNREPAEIRQATEAFLSLEFKGWKGVRKTALLAASSETTFFRSMTRILALQGKCRIDSLEIDGVPVAMGVVLETGNTAFFWKTTYDERFAALSPGVQLTLELTNTQLASRAIALTDSCATPDHPMIDHIWRERIAIADVLLAIPHAQGLSFTAGLWLEFVRQHLRSKVKPFLKRLLRRRH